MRARFLGWLRGDPLRRRVSRWALRDPARLGREGEWLAYGLLVRKGYDVVARNWRAPFGEVDLVALRGEALHLVEVKTRRRHEVFRPEDRVDTEKMERYRDLGVYFLKSHRLDIRDLRCHLVAITVDEDGRATLELHENAF